MGVTLSINGRLSHIGLNDDFMQFYSTAPLIQLRITMRVFLKAIPLFIIFIMLSTFVSAFGSESKQLNNSDLTTVILTVLNYKDVSMFLHPDVPSRVPVIIAIAKPYSYRPIEMNMYGEPVIVTTNPKDLKIAVKLKIKCKSDVCTIEISYDPEGMFGEIVVSKEKRKWSVKEAIIYE